MALTTGRLILLAGTGAGLAVAIPGSYDLAVLPRATALWLTALLLLALAVLTYALGGRPVRLRAPATVAAAALAGAALLTVATAHAPWDEAFGLFERYTGGLTFVAAAVLLLSAGRLLDERWLVGLCAVVAAGTTLAAVHVLVDLLRGSDWLSAGMGNPNFGSAVIGIGIAPLAALAQRMPRAGRPVPLAGLALSAAALAAIFQVNGVVQGPAAAGTGLLVWGVATRPVLPPADRRRVDALLGACLLLAVVVLLGLGRVGPLGFLGADSSLHARAIYWRTALTMIADDWPAAPGAHTYAARYERTASAEDIAWFRARTQERGVPHVPDTPHSVPLEQALRGGALLAGAAAVAAGLTGWALLSGLRRRAGPLLGAVGGAWAAYLVQALVSIDSAPLPQLGWTLAGATFAAAGLRPVPAGAATGRQGRRGVRALAAGGAVGIAGFVAAWLLCLPLATALAEARADRLARAGEPAAALTQIELATRLAPWRTESRYFHAQLLAQAGRPAEAHEALLGVTARRPDDPVFAQEVARSAVRLGRTGEAVRWYRLAAAGRPHSPEVLREGARELLRLGEREQAALLLAALLRAHPGDEEGLLLRRTLALHPDRARLEGLRQGARSL